MGDELDFTPMMFGYQGAFGEYIPIGEVPEYDVFVSEGCGGYDRSPLRDFCGSLTFDIDETELGSFAETLADLPLVSFPISLRQLDWLAIVSRHGNIWEYRRERKGRPRCRKGRR